MSLSLIDRVKGWNQYNNRHSVLSDTLSLCYGEGFGIEVRCSVKY